MTQTQQNPETNLHEYRDGKVARLRIVFDMPS